MNVVQLFEPKPIDFLIGPFEEYRVVIDGRVIPLLSAQKLESGKVNLVLDNRFCVCCESDAAHQVAWIMANALAVGQGYPSIGATTKDRPFAPIAMQIGSVETNEDPK